MFTAIIYPWYFQTFYFWFIHHFLLIYLFLFSRDFYIIFSYFSLVFIFYYFIVSFFENLVFQSVTFHSPSPGANSFHNPYLSLLWSIINRRCWRCFLNFSSSEVYPMHCFKIINMDASIFPWQKRGSRFVTLPEFRSTFNTISLFDFVICSLYIFIWFRCFRLRYVPCYSALLTLSEWKSFHLSYNGIRFLPNTTRVCKRNSAFCTDLVIFSLLIVSH